MSRQHELDDVIGEGYCVWYNNVDVEYDNNDEYEWGEEASTNTKPTIRMRNHEINMHKKLNVKL